MRVYCLMKAVEFNGPGVLVEIYDTQEKSEAAAKLLMECYHGDNPPIIFVEEWEVA